MGLVKQTITQRPGQLYTLDGPFSPMLQTLEVSGEGSAMTLEPFILHIYHIMLLTYSRPEKILYSGYMQ